MAVDANVQHFETDAMRAYAQSNARRFMPAWMLYVVIALLFGVYMGINAILGLEGNAHFATWKPMTWELSSVVVIFAMLPLVVQLERKFPVDERPRWRAALIHTLAALVFSGVHSSGMFAIRKLIYALAGENYLLDGLGYRFLYELQKDLLTYLIILVVLFAYRQLQVRRFGELRAAELSAELSQAKLRHLTAQVEPHFLFNALNAISNRMHEDVEAADRMISELGGLLRAAYDTDNQVLVPLARELEWLRGYTAMMTERFRGQLIFHLTVAPGLEQVQVPRLLLQPLVENALRHGLAEGRGQLTVEVECRQGVMHYRVSDDGKGIQGDMKSGTGTSNVRRRLELLYPGAHHFALSPREPAGTVANVSFPITA
jgi:two-component system, LytTR family, sensor kinase